MEGMTVNIGASTEGSFEASAHYDDWEGTAAADNSDQGSLEKFLRDQGQIGSDEFLIAISLSDYKNMRVQAFAFRKEPDFVSAKEALASIDGPIPVRKVDANLTPEEFFDRFKIFSLTLTKRKFKLQGREFSIVDSATK